MLRSIRTAALATVAAAGIVAAVAVAAQAGQPDLTVQPNGHQDIHQATGPASAVVTSGTSQGSGPAPKGEEMPAGAGR